MQVLGAVNVGVGEKRGGRARVGDAIAAACSQPKPCARATEAVSLRLFDRLLVFQIRITEANLQLNQKSSLMTVA